MFQPVLVERIKGRVADQRVDIPVFSVMDEIVAVAQEVVRLVPTETRATMDPRAFCGCVISSDVGGDCRDGEVGPIVEVPRPQISEDVVGELKRRLHHRSNLRKDL